MKKNIFIWLLFVFCKPFEIPDIDLESYTNYVVYIHYAGNPKPSATGFLLKDNQHILTCEHAVNLFKDQIFISYKEEELIPVRVIKFDKMQDLALLKSEKKIKIFANFSVEVEENIEINREVFAFGAMYGYKSTFLRGYISYPLRKNIDYTKNPYIQIMGLAYSGMSGAPVFSYTNGKFIGIVRGVYGFGIENGNSMVIPVSTIKDFLKDTELF